MPQRALGLMRQRLALLIFLLPRASAPISAPTWTAGSGWLSACARTTLVFDIPICLTSAAYAGASAKYNHVANVMAQLLDNDADGAVDDADVHAKMLRDQFYLFVPATESDNENAVMPGSGFGQMSGLWEAIPNSCDTPSNRGASATDRSTWAAAKDTSSGCSAQRDATTEEILHLITEAAAQLWPQKWGGNYESEAGVALSALNGNCGWGYASNYINPSSTGCNGQYAYDDNTCDKPCVVVEGIYWASVAYMGGLYTTSRANSIQNEWLMPTPDDGMAVVPSGVANARTLQSGSPALYALVSDTTSAQHRWLPSIMPDGNYQGSASTAFTSGVSDAASAFGNAGVVVASSPAVVSTSDGSGRDRVELEGPKIHDGVGALYGLILAIIMILIPIGIMLWKHKQRHQQSNRRTLPA